MESSGDENELGEGRTEFIIDEIRGEKEDAHDDESHQGGMLYDVTSNPPIHITIAYAVQLLLSNIGATLSCVYLVQSNLCAGDNDVLFADLLATGIFMVGFTTLLQVTIGCRLPIYQGSARSFIPALTAVMIATQGDCQQELERSGNTDIANSSIGLVDSNFSSPGNVSGEAKYIQIINEVSGGLILASIVQVLVGFSGIIGALMHFVGPLTIAPLVTLIGLGLIRSTNLACQHHWGIAMLTIALVYLFSIVLEKFTIPIPVVSLKGKCRKVRTPIFKLFPQILALMTSWSLCGILTATNVFPNDKSSPNYRARTDAKIDVLSKVSWINVPYPGQWGTPTFSIGPTLGFLAAILVSMIDTAGDYYATSRVCGIPPPPKHAINRGIFIEGVGRICSGLVGACHATSSYSTPIGFIQLTGVSSRMVWQVASIMIMLIGLLGKVTGCLSLVPDPVIGGLAAVGLMVLVGVALSNLYCVDLNSARNQVVLGTSLMLGLMVPTYIRGHPGCIQTGNKNADQVLTIMLCTGICVGGITACILDNILPGTRKERGMALRTNTGTENEISSTKDHNLTIYDLPYITHFLRNYKWSTFIPISPTFSMECCKK